MTNLTPEELMRMAAAWQTQSGFNAQKAQENAKPSTEYWNPKNGITVIRLLPPGRPGNKTSSEGWWAKKYFKYWIQFPGSKANAAGKAKEETSILYDGRRSCPNDGFADPIEDVLDDLSATLPSEIIKGMRSKARCLVNVLIKEVYDERNNRIDADLSGKVVVADMPIGFFDHLKKEQVNPLNGDYLNPFMGLDIIITRTGQGKNGTNYTYGVRPGALKSPILDDISKIPAMLDSVKDLADLVAESSNRDQPKLAETAAKIREWAAAMAQVNPFGGAVQQGNITSSGFVPGAFPGSFGGNTYAQPQQPWQPPQQPPQAVQWPQPGQQPPQAPQWPQAQQAPQTPPWAAPQPPVQTQQAPPPQQQAATPAQAPAPQAVTRPACYKQYFAKNGNGCPIGQARDEGCKKCVFATPCSFESTPV